MDCVDDSAIQASFSFDEVGLPLREEREYRNASTRRFYTPISQGQPAEESATGRNGHSKPLPRTLFKQTIRTFIFMDRKISEICCESELRIT